MLHKFCNSIMKYIYAYDAGSFPGDSEGKESACNGGSLGLIPESGRLPGEGNAYPLQHSSLENPMDRGPGGLQSMESQSQTQLSN